MTTSSPVQTSAEHPAEPFPTLLDPAHLAHAEAVFRDLVMVRFPFETRIGHYLAYLRTYASPSVVGLLAHTGHIEHAPDKRAVDTGLLMYELFAHGLDSPVGHQVVAQLNRMHQHWRISNEDYVWVLGTFTVLGPQVIDRLAWRRLTAPERQATVDWWRELGTRMGITDIPITFEDFADAFEDYERRRLRRTEKGQALLTASWPVMLAQLPAAVRPLARQVTALLTDEPARSALGLPRPSRLTTVAVSTALLARGVARRTGDSTAPQFTSGQPQPPHYPNGYTIERLGISDQHEHPARRRLA